MSADPRDPFSLAGRVALVTGSTRGIGLAVARQLAARGAAVVISSRKADACAAVAAELSTSGARALAVAAHAAKENDIRALIGKTIETFGRLDVVVANAGINPTFDPLAELSEDSLGKVIETNLMGPLRLARHAMPHLAVQGGAFVVVSSVNARFAAAGAGAYSLSKAALEQMVRQLALEWGGKNVRVNAVAPGTVRTDMIRALVDRPGFMDSIMSSTPLRRIAEAEDIASVVAFFASEAARHVTGQSLVVDGGQTITRGAASDQN